VPAGTYTLTIPGANEDANQTGDLDITSDLTINGAGAHSTVIQSLAHPLRHHSHLRRHCSERVRRGG